MTLHAVPTNIGEARAFVDRHHRHHPAPDTEAGPVIEAQKALIRAIEKRTWAAAAGPVVPGGAEVNAAIRAFRDAIEREAAARALAEVRKLREAAASLYSIAVGEHGHDETHSADWPSCLPAHIAMRRYRAAIKEAPRD